MSGKVLKAYLAGPDVFLPDPVEAGNRKKLLCTLYSIIGLYPLDSQLDLSAMHPTQAGTAISRANEQLIRECDIVIANITPFRGPSLDVGTAYEIGVARTLGKPVYAYSNTTTPFAARTHAYINGDVDEHSMTVEDFNMFDNLMIDAAIHDSGGCLVCVDVPKQELFTSMVAFEQLLQHITKEGGE